MVDYLEVCEAFDRIEALSKRLEMTDELIKLLKDRDPDDLLIMIRLVQGEVGPSYEGLDLGIAEKLITRSAQLVTSIDEEAMNEYRNRSGDIGTTLENVIVHRKQASLFSEPLTIDRVFNNLVRIARKEGRSSQDVKLKIIAEMLNDAKPLEAKYLGRLLASKMRMGISTMTIIDALSYTFNDRIYTGIRELSEMDLGDKGDELIDQLISHRTAPIYELIDLLSRKRDNPVEGTVRLRSLEFVKGIRDRSLEIKGKIEAAYNVHPDLARISQRISKNGLLELDKIKVKVGIPLRSMLGERLSSIEEIIEKLNGRCAFEYKYDGLRIQAHLKKCEGSIEVKLFSRQLEDITKQYPDVVEAVSKSFKGDDCIVEGECVPVDGVTGELLPFQVISQRRGRKFDLDAKVEEIPVQLVLFDCLMKDGEGLLTSPLLVRREAIISSFPDIEEDMDLSRGVSLSTLQIIEKMEDGEKFFSRSLEDGCEGIMAKSISPDSSYQAGSRGWNWIKFKRDYHSELKDTLDLVVVGAYHGSGKRKGLFGALLMAVFNHRESRFETLCKLGTGFTDELLSEVLDRLKDHALETPPTDVLSGLEADVYFHPELVLEVMGAEISHSPVHTAGWQEEVGSGYALRFPRFTGRFRDDKSAEQATTVKEVIDLYRLQNKRV